MTYRISPKVGVINGTISKNHLVFGQSPGLVTENVADLSEFFGDVQRATVNSKIVLGIVEVQVLRDKVDLTEFDDLDCDVEGNRDENLTRKILT